MKIEAMYRGVLGCLLAVVFVGSALAAESAGVRTDACGNGVLDAGESCDDGNRVAGDCCSPDCRVEESHLGCAGDCLCATCGDGIDNDGDGLADAEDPKCATLAALQRYAWIAPGATAGEAPPAVLARPARAAGALAGSAVAGVCDAGFGACVCPEGSPACQPAGRPCGSDADCEPAPYPEGESRAWVCDGNAIDEEACIRAAAQVGREIDALGALAGLPLALAPVDAEAVRELRFDSGVQVVDIDLVEVAPGGEIVLVGEPDTVVVLRVAVGLAVGDGGVVRVDGELAADRVLWVVAAGGGLRLGDAARFVGSVLVDEPARVSLGSDLAWDGAALGALRGPS